MEISLNRKSKTSKQKKILEMQSTRTKMKNSLEEIKGKYELAEENISELEGCQTEKEKIVEK